MTRIFGHFVEEKHAVVCKADLTRFCLCAAAHQSRHGGRVMRSSERSRRHNSHVAVEYARNRVNLGHFDCLFKGHFGHNRRHAFCKHGFACAGRAYHKCVMSARNRDFESAFCNGLPFHVRKVHAVAVIHARRLVSRGRHFLVYHAREHLDDLTEIFECVYVYAFNKTCLSCV